MKEYIESLEKACEREVRDTLDQVSINEKRMTGFILKEILRDFEMQGYELPLTVFADVAGGGSVLMEGAKSGEPYFVAEGIELQRRNEKAQK